MYSLFYFFVYGFFFYLIYKAIRFFIQYLNEPEQPRSKPNQNRPGNSKPRIKSEDIIDAEFEEIKPAKKDNQKI